VKLFLKILVLMLSGTIY